MKKISKIFLYLLLVLVSAYLIFAFYFGGFGKKVPVVILANSTKKTLLFAHRAISLYYPENSLEGIEAAKLYGFKAVEVDIRRSADGQLIIFHDANAARLLGLNKEVNTLNLAELKKHPILSGAGKTSTAFIQTVDELLSAEKESVVFYFDMKLSSFKDADEIVALVKLFYPEKFKAGFPFRILFPNQ